jgi:hypothetical protein
MIFGTLNVKSLYEAVSLMKVAKEITKCKLELVGMKEVRWNRGGKKPAGQETNIKYKTLINFVWNK